MGASTAGDELAIWREELQLPERSLSRLRPPSPMADDVMKLRIRDERGHSSGVALCSSPGWPDMVARGVERARAARGALGDELGAVVLEPVREGRLDGRSYAVLPYHEPLPGGRLAWAFQRPRFRTAVADWLAEATARTARLPEGAELEAGFRAPLRALSELAGVSERVRAAAGEAFARLEGGWSPRHVLMHGDLWPGNVLRADNRFGFVLIDWAGSRTDGHGVFDLLRWAEATRLGAAPLRARLEVHCSQLDCDVADARSTLLGALARIASSLGEFPLDQFAAMAERCLDGLARAGA